MYSEVLLDHFQNPRNAGDLPGANARARVENPVCADTLELALKIENEVITEAKFLAKGCVPAIACASLLTELVSGAKVQQADDISAENLRQRIGGLPEASSHAAQMAIDALRSALRRHRTRAAKHG